MPWNISVQVKCILLLDGSLSLLFLYTFCMLICLYDILHAGETFWLSIGFFTLFVRKAWSCAAMIIPSLSFFWLTSLQPCPRIRVPNFLATSDKLSMEGFFAVLSGMIVYLWFSFLSRILLLKNLTFAYSFSQPSLGFLEVTLYIIAPTLWSFKVQLVHLSPRG